MADGVETAPLILDRRHLEPIHTRLLVEADNLGQLVWDVSVDSTINRAHQQATNPARSTGGRHHLSNYTNLKLEPVDHALGRSRGA